MNLVNEYAPEHLILSIENPENILSEITNAGSIFRQLHARKCRRLRKGTNHTLPTNGNARAYSGVSLDSFVKENYHSKNFWKRNSEFGKTIEKMAAEEGLFAHKMQLRCVYKIFINRKSNIINRKY